MKDEPRILLLTDFSAASRAAFRPTAELARRLGGRITLLHVVHELVAIPHGAPLAPPVSIPPVDVEEILARARHDLDELAKELGPDVPVEVAVESGSRVWEAVHRYARDHDVDFIALATHGRTGLRRVMLGSVGEEVLRHSRVPVILYPAAD